MKTEITTEQAIRRAIHIVRVLVEVDWAAVDAELTRLHEAHTIEATEEQLLERADALDPAALAAFLRPQVGRVVDGVRQLVAAGSSLAAFARFDEAVSASVAAFVEPEQLDAEAVHAALVGVGHLTPEALSLLPAARVLVADTDEQTPDPAETPAERTDPELPPAGAIPGQAHAPESQPAPAEG